MAEEEGAKLGSCISFHYLGKNVRLEMGCREVFSEDGGDDSCFQGVRNDASGQTAVDDAC